jgi:hypothetical protein
LPAEGGPAWPDFLHPFNAPHAYSTEAAGAGKMRCMDRKAFQFDIRQVLAAMTIIAVCLAITRSAVLTLCWLGFMAIAWYVDSSFQSVDPTTGRPSVRLRIAGAICGAPVGIVVMFVARLFGVSEHLSEMGLWSQGCLGAGLGAVVGIAWPRIAVSVMYVVMELMQMF